MCSVLVFCAARSKSGTSPFVVSQLLFFSSGFLHPKRRRKILGLLPFPGFIFGQVCQSWLKVSLWSCFHFPTDENFSLCHVSACLQLSLRRAGIAAAETLTEPLSKAPGVLQGHCVLGGKSIFIHFLLYYPLTGQHGGAGADSSCLRATPWTNRQLIPGLTYKDRP